MRNRFFPLVAGLSALVAVAVSCSVPQLADYRVLPLAQTSFLYTSNGSLITQFHAREDRVVLRFNQMPQSMRDATVAIEDRRFYWHHGFDLQAIARAAYDDAVSGQIVEGGSTITQQLVKNLYVGNADTLRRKFDEAALAWQLEDRLSKDQIITRYLNTVYFGEGAYGLQAAAQTYFAEDAMDLSVSQSAMLAGLITAPNHFDPYLDPQAALGRRNVVLRLMHEQRFVATRPYVAALARPLDIRQDRGPTERYPYPYFVDYFKRWFLSNPRFGADYADRKKLLFTGGLHIETTLDAGLQNAAQSAVDSILSYPQDPAGAMTVLDPRTGYVRAMVGGDPQAYWRRTGSGRVNLATGAGGSGRQTGSAFKVFALVSALENGYTPSSVFPAPASLNIPLDDGRVWHVTNAEGSGYGSMTLLNATINSVNTVYAQLMMDLGPDRVIETADRMGMRCCMRVGEPKTPLLPVPSAVLGTNQVNTLEMASAYGTLATGGRHVNPVPAIRITDAQGNVIWQAHPTPRQVVDPQVASVADSVLQQVVLYGTGTSANIGRPQIGKTGTAETHTNAWFVGSLPQLTASVWVGFPQGQIPMEPPRTRITVFGGTWPAQIWRLFMLDAARDLPPRGFPTPQVGYVSATVDDTQDPYCLPNPYTLPQNIRTMQFIVGTQPTKTCTTPTSLQNTAVPPVIGMQLHDAEAALRASGFYVKVVLTHSTQPPGVVVYESPAPGTEAYTTSTVTITVSRAPGPGG